MSNTPKNQQAPQALAGVRSVFLHAEAAAVDAFAKEAAGAGVEHVVLLSSSAVLAPDAAGPGAYSDPVHETDLAEAACAVLTDSSRGGRAYTLTGPRTLTFASQLAILGDVVGHSIPFEAVSCEQWKAGGDGCIPGPCAEALLDFWAASDGLPVDLTDDLERLIGHAPRTFETWCADHADAFRA